MSEAHMKKIEDDLMTAELSRAIHLSVENKALRDERDRLRRDYDELIMAVGNKYPGETRHQTALRYIQRAEEPSNVPAKAALMPAGGGRDGQ